MIHVLVVEDEPPILKNVCRNIEKCHEQFKVVGRAFDGREALDFLEANPNRVDVLVTDIHMPVMNGLELLERVSSAYPEMVRMVLSGYQDFHYAKEAFKTGIFDYLLKPIDRKNLRKQLLAVAEHIRSVRADTIDHLLSEAFGQTGDFRPLEEFLKGRAVTMLLLCAGPFPVTEYDFLLPGRGFWEQLNLGETVSRYFTRQEFWIVPGKSSAEQLVILFSDEPLPSSYISNLHWTLSRRGSLPVTLCASPAIREIAGIPHIHHMMRIGMHKKLIFSRSGLIPYDPEAEKLKSSYDLRNLQEEHKRDLGFLSHEKLIDAILARTEGFARTEHPQEEWEQYLKFTFYTLLNTVGGTDAFGRTEMLLNDLITNAYEKEDLLQGVEQILRDILIPKGVRREKNEILVREIEDFLTLNYSQPLSNQSLSNKFGLAPSYISSLFKSEMGVSPAEYILKLRMHHAKDQLRQNKDLMTREIAQMVGYSDPLYFSRVFKKYFGKSPSQVRKESLFRD